MDYIHMQESLLFFLNIKHKLLDKIVPFPYKYSSYIWLCVLQWLVHITPVLILVNICCSRLFSVSFEGHCDGISLYINFDKSIQFTKSRVSKVGASHCDNRISIIIVWNIRQFWKFILNFWTVTSLGPY
jgi:hypothetical protein